MINLAFHLLMNGLSALYVFKCRNRMSKKLYYCPEIYKKLMAGNLSMRDNKQVKKSKKKNPRLNLTVYSK